MAEEVGGVADGPWKRKGAKSWRRRGSVAAAGRFAGGGGGGWVEVRGGGLWRG